MIVTVAAAVTEIVTVNVTVTVTGTVTGTGRVTVTGTATVIIFGLWASVKDGGSLEVDSAYVFKFLIYMMLTMPVRMPV